MTTAVSPHATTEPPAAETPGRKRKRSAPAGAFDALLSAMSVHAHAPAVAVVPVSPARAQLQVPTKPTAAIDNASSSKQQDARSPVGATPTVRATGTSTVVPHDAPIAVRGKLDVQLVSVSEGSTQSTPHENDRVATASSAPLRAAIGRSGDGVDVDARNSEPAAQSAPLATSIRPERSAALAIPLRESLPSRPSQATPIVGAPTTAAPPATRLVPLLPTSTKSSADVRAEAGAAALAHSLPEAADAQARPGLATGPVTRLPHASGDGAATRATDADATDVADAQIRWIAPAAAAATPAASARSELGRQRHLSLQAQASGILPLDGDIQFAGIAASSVDAIATLVALEKAASATAQPATQRASADADIDFGAGVGSLAWSATGDGMSAPQVGASALPVAFDGAAWREAMARQVSSAALAQTHETSVRLDAKGLGPIEVHVRVAADRVDVHFLIQRPITADIVRDALPDLQRLLGQSGMTLGDASVAQQHAGGRRGDAAPFRAGVASIGAGEETIAESTHSPRIRVGLLDHFA